MKWNKKPSTKTMKRRDFNATTNQRPFYNLKVLFKLFFAEFWRREKRWREQEMSEGTHWEERRRGLKSNPCSYDNRSLSSNGGFRADSSILDIQVTETVILSRKQNYGYFNETQASHILIKMSLEFVRQNNQNNLASYCQGKQSSVETEDITLQY